jgi:hypothetical protein
LFEEEGSLQAEFLDASFHAREADAGGVVCFFDFVHALLELDAFSAVGFFDRRGESRRYWP